MGNECLNSSLTKSQSMNGEKAIENIDTQKIKYYGSKNNLVRRIGKPGQYGTINSTGFFRNEPVEISCTK